MIMRGRCAGLTILPPSCANCNEIGEPQSPATLIEVRWCNHFCSVKATNLTYSECVSVALVTQYAMHTYGLSGSNLFFHIISQSINFRFKKLNIKCFRFFYDSCLKHFLF